MKMKNKIELKRTIIISVCIIVFWCITFLLFNFYQYKIYTNKFNTKIQGIIVKVTDEYPDIEKRELIEVLNSEEIEDNGILRDYGINIKNDSIIIENEYNFKIFATLNIIVLLTLSISLLVTFMKYNNKKDKKLKEITKYIEEINRKNYKLNIDDNTEDELSILKNEIYKTTIMLNEQAENSIKDKLMLKESLSDISHQLKTPLTSITIMLDNILDNSDMDKETRNDFIKNIRREINNINFLVQSLLKLSRLDTNTIKFINKDVKVIDIINETVKNVSMICDLKNIHINIDGDSNICINCDIKWQIEALTNILKNSIEYSKESSEVKIKYKKNKMYCQIEIIDTGSGIDMKDMPHIFERFYKGKNSSKDSIGIGLALSKTIIEKDNGTVSVESKKDKGTVFIIRYYEQT